MKFIYPFLLSIIVFLTGCDHPEETTDTKKVEESLTVEKELFNQKITNQPEKLSLQEAIHYFASVALHAKENYVQSVDYQELLDGALKGMLSNLDPHSDFLSKEEFTELQQQTSGHYGGLGLEVTMEDGLLRVIAPVDDSPAARAGLKVGDFIVRIEKLPVYGMSLAQAIESLKGEPKTEINLTIRRPGQEDFPVKLTREVIQTDPVRSEIKENILYMRISTFHAKTASTVQQAIADARKEQKDALKGILIDLRNNAGGLFEEAIKLANIFIDKGTIVSVHTSQGHEIRHVKARREGQDPLTKDLSVAVLMNGGTASSSEIFAAAIQDHNRGIILGTQSFGKGSVQSVIPLKNGAAIKLTTALYYAPKGGLIQKHGVSPDIVIPQVSEIASLDESERLKEADLRTAIISEMEKYEESFPEAKTLKGKPKKIEDYQLNQALYVLQGIIHAQNKTEKNLDHKK